MYLFFMSIPCRTRAQHIEYCKKCQTISLHQVSNGYMSVWGQVQCHIQRYSPVKMFLYAITSLYADTAHVFCTFLCSCQGLRCKYPFLCSCVQKNVCMKMARFCVCVYGRIMSFTFYNCMYMYLHSCLTFAVKPLSSLKKELMTWVMR